MAVVRAPVALQERCLQDGSKGPADMNHESLSLFLVHDEQSGCHSDGSLGSHSIAWLTLNRLLSSLMNEVVVTHPTIGSNVEEVRLAHTVMAHVVVDSRVSLPSTLLLVSPCCVEKKSRLW
jgi:hypothetical protein